MRTSGDLTMLDLSNILKWFEKIPKNDENFERYARTYQKIQGLIAIDEDRSEPLIENLLEETFFALDYSDAESIQKAKHLLETRHNRLEHLIAEINSQSQIKLAELRQKKRIVEKEISGHEEDAKNYHDTLCFEIEKITRAIKKIDEKLKDES